MAQIKRIQLRGISRTPSDRLTADGGCAESLNVYLDSEETAPVLKPEDITEKVGLVGNRKFSRVFIHKMQTKENYICVGETDDSFVEVGVYVGDVFRTIFTLDRGDAVVNITSFGNTIGITTNQSTYWFLYKNGVYSELGTKVPFPNFTLANYEVEGRDLDDAESELEVVRRFKVSDWKLNDDRIRKFDFEALEESFEGNRPIEDEDSLSLLTELWKKFQQAETVNRKQSVFNHQVHAVLAIKLIDESEIISAPIVLGAGFNQPLTIEYKNLYGEYYESGGDGENSYSNTEYTYSTELDCKINAAYKLFLKINEATDFFDNWKDIIDSINVYISNRVATNLPKDSAIGRNVDTVITDDSNIDEETGNGYRNHEAKTTAVIELGNAEYDYEQEHLNASVFKLFKSYRLQDLEKLAEGVVVEVKEEEMSEDYIPDLLDFQKASMVNYDTTFSDSTTYNSRLIVSGIKETKEFSIPSLNAVNFTNKELVDEFIAPYPKSHDAVGLEQYYRLTFYLRDNDGNEMTIAAKHPFSKGSSKASYIRYGDDLTLKDMNVYANAFQFIICPDRRAYKVDVEFSASNGIKSIAHLDLKEHPFLSCSYYYGGMDMNLADACDDFESSYIDAPTSFIEDIPNKIYISKVDSPFIFPIGSRYTFQSRVLGVAIAAVALSQGQFGQFPLYVFTEDGIWAMETATDGSFVSPKPLPREVCSNPASITPIDQAVVFMSDKGLMLLQGSQITELSPYMNGKHYALNGSATTIVNGQQKFTDLIEAMSNPQAFMEFMKGAEIGYDYQGKRLICFNKDEAYQYVYKLDTQTWHKLFHPGAAIGAMPLNSYPRCEVMTVAGDATRIVDFSTSLDGSNTQTPERGVVVSRPFDLQEPDVLKTITDVRVRGNFAKGAVKFILQGSQDGINFHTISTLRGQSWKLFRIILLADLSLHERISWIDVMYESRFTNRLR